MANAVYFSNPFDPQQRQVFPVQNGLTIAEWLDRSGFAQTLLERPTVVMLNGVELLEAQYGITLKDGDIVGLATLPEGAALAWAATITWQTWVAVGFAVVSTALTLYGMQEPSLDEGSLRDSPNHNLSVRNNRARLGQPKPVLYGTARVYPDLASQPYGEFDADGDQVVFMLFELTQGYAAVNTSTMRFEDTLLSDFDDAEYEVIEPGETSTLYSNEVTVSDTVENLELTSANLGPFAANPSATQITSIAVDVVAPQGIFRQRSSGKTDRATVQFRVEAREIDDDGSAIGSWTTLGTEYLSGHSPDAIRKTLRYSVTAGRYEVRMIRITPESTDKTSLLVQWTQMRAYHADSLPTTNTTRIAVRIRSTEQLGTRALTEFNVVATRKLYTWSSSTGWSASPTATTNPAWAFADACRADYGGKRADAYIDLEGLETLASWCTSNGFECNGIIDTQMSLWDALTRIAQTAHCMPIDRAGIYQMVQDAPATTAVQMFNMRNIVRDSFSTDHAGVLEETADHVVIEFYDEDQDYRLTTIPCVLPGGTSLKPRTVKLWGVTAKAQAYEIGMRMGASNRYRRQLVSFDTGLEGRIPGYMDLVRVSHHQLGAMGAVQRSGDVLSYDGTDTLTVTESLTGLFTTPYVVLHNLNGEPVGAYQCTILGDTTIRVDEAFDDSGLVFESGYARPRFQIGEGSTFDKLIKVTKVTPTGQQTVRIEGFVDNSAVYTITNGQPVPDPEELAGLRNRYPVVSRIVARGLGKNSEPTIILTWDAKNADRYVIEYSTDGGSTWIEAGRTRDREFVDAPEYQGEVRYRIAGLSLFRGPWETITINTTTIVNESVWIPFDAPISVQVTATNGFSWVYSDSAWSPAGLTTDVTFTFRQLGEDIAERVVRFTLDDEAGTVTAATLGTPTGDDTTLHLTNNGGATVVASVEHDDSGYLASQTVLALVGGASGAKGDPGDPGDSVDIVFRRAASQPSTPSASPGVPLNWYSDVNSVPAASDPLWAMVGEKSGGASNYTWQTPFRAEGQDGADGTNGADGVDGEDGTSIVWQGEFASHPGSPQNGWAYRNSTDGKSYVRQDGTWYQMTVDGTDGQDGSDGISISWRGESASPPANPQANWVYRDTDNGQVYIYNGTAWELMVLDGSDGETGAAGDDGLSVYITYHDSAVDLEPSTPTGDGTSGGWHTAATSAAKWMSQKVAADASSGTWGAPVRIRGDAGDAFVASAAFWDFNGSQDGWTQLGIALTANPTYIHLAPSDADPRFQSPTSMGISGAQSTLVRARVRRTVAGSWQGSCFYETSDNLAHGFVSTHYKFIPDTTVLDEWVILEWDMADLTAGGTNWVDSTIKRIRFDLCGAGIDSEFDIDWIAIGRIAPAVDGSDGLSVAELTIFKRASSEPDTPTGGSFDFGTKTLTPPSGWSVAFPSGTDPVYTSRSVASVSGASGTDNTLTWSEPVKSFQNGTDGQDGSDGATGPRVFTGRVYYQLVSEAQPATPSATDFDFTAATFTGLTANWSTAAPTFEAANPNRYWYAYVQVIESVFNDPSPTISFTDPLTAMQFSGLVKFTGDNVITDGAGNELSFGSTGTTEINGGQITTGVLNAERVSIDGVTLKHEDGVLKILHADWSEHVVGAFKPEDGATNNKGELFVEDFADNDLAAFQGRWSVAPAIAGEEEIATVTSSAMGGQYALAIGNSTDNDLVRRIGSLDRAVPIERNVIYKITFHIYQSLGSGVWYLGVAGVASDKATPVNTGGDASWTSGQHYVARSAYSPTLGQWETAAGYFMVTGGSPDLTSNTGNDPSILHPDVRYVVPFMMVNHPGSPGRTFVSYVKLERVGLGDDVAGYTADTVEGPGQFVEGASASDGNSYRAVTRGMAVGDVRDGDTVEFDPEWGTVPEVRYTAGGLSYSPSLNGAQGQAFDAIARSESGFTVRAKLRELAGTPTARTDSGAAAQASVVDWSIDKNQSAQAWDDKYTFDFDVTVGNSYIPYVNSYIAGSAKVGIYTNDGSGWVKGAEIDVQGGYTGATTTVNRTVTVTVDGLGLGDDFGIALEYDLYGGSSLTFNEVRYATASAPAEVTATPTGARDLTYIVFGGLE